MKIRAGLWVVWLGFLVWSGEPDPLLRDLDLSRLELPSPPANGGAREPDRNLAAGWERLPDFLREAELPDADEVQEITLPAGPLLVVANPTRVSDAYGRIAEALETTGLTPAAPLALVIHADDNVSLGCLVEGEIDGPVPMGVSVSPQPVRRLLVVPAGATEATRRDAALPPAAGRLRRAAAARGLQPQSRELYLILGANQTVLLGMPVESP